MIGNGKILLLLLMNGGSDHLAPIAPDRRLAHRGILLQVMHL